MKEETNLTKWQKFLNILWLILKIGGIVLLAVFTGKFLWNFLGTKKELKVHLSDLKNKKWAKHPDDETHPREVRVLTDEEIEKELDKLDN